jgi:hypothetical protein
LNHFGPIDLVVSTNCEHEAVVKTVLDKPSAPSESTIKMDAAIYAAPAAAAGAIAAVDAGY